jgi:sugar-specific transcriptional regulator TrmB
MNILCYILHIKTEIMQNIRSTLGALGLSNNEISLYLAALSLGESGITDIAAKSKLKQSTVYLTFDSLQKRGMMGSFKTRRGTRFVASPPTGLLTKLQESISQVQEVLPQLEALVDKESPEPKIFYYHGKEGYLTIARQSLEVPDTTIRHIGSLTEAYKVLGPKYDQEVYIPERIRKGISLKALYFGQDSKRELSLGSDASKLREVRFLPKDVTMKVSKVTYGNRVAISTSQKELGVVIIESAEIAEAERQSFDLMWRLLEGAGL